MSCPARGATPPCMTGAKGRTSVPESRPEVARPPRVTIRRPEDPAGPRSSRSRAGRPPPPQTDRTPPSRAADRAPCAYTSPAGRGPKGTSQGWRGDGEGPGGTGRGMEGLRWGPAASASRPGPGFAGRPERRTPGSNTRAPSPESAAAYPKPQAGAASVHSRPTVTLETRSPTPSTSPMRPNPLPRIASGRSSGAALPSAVSTSAVDLPTATNSSASTGMEVGENAKASKRGRTA